MPSQEAEGSPSTGPSSSFSGTCAWIGAGAGGGDASVRVSFWASRAIKQPALEFRTRIRGPVRGLAWRYDRRVLAQALRRREVLHDEAPHGSNCNDLRVFEVSHLWQERPSISWRLGVLGYTSGRRHLGAPTALAFSLFADSPLLSSMVRRPYRSLITTETVDGSWGWSVAGFVGTPQHKRC